MGGVNTPSSSNPVISAQGFFYVHKESGDPTRLSFMNMMIELGLHTMKNTREAFQTQFERAQELVKCMEELNAIVKTINNVKTSFPGEDVKSDDLMPSGDLQKQIDAFNQKWPKANLSFTLADTFKRYPANETSDLGKKFKDLIGDDDKLPKGIKAGDYSKLAGKKDKDITGNKDTTFETYMNNNPASYPYSLVTKKGIENLGNNAQTAQSTLSSENEQQNMRTNQAMNRSSGFLQQLQSMMQSAREALMAAAKAGGS